MVFAPPQSSHRAKMVGSRCWNKARLKAYENTLYKETILGFCGRWSGLIEAQSHLLVPAENLILLHMGFIRLPNVKGLFFFLRLCISYAQKGKFFSFPVSFTPRSVKVIDFLYLTAPKLYYLISLSAKTGVWGQKISPIFTLIYLPY